MKRIKNHLPNTLWQTIEVALADLEKIEAAKDKYVIDMEDSYHTLEYTRPGRNPPPPRCEVCLAGAVMAMTLNSKQEETLYPSDFTYDIPGKLSALDSIRCGYVAYALATFYGKPVEKFNNIVPYAMPVPRYSDDPVKFKESVQHIVIKLKALGL